MPVEQGHIIRDSRLQIVIRKRIDLAESRENWPEAHISAKTYAKASLKPALTVGFWKCEGRKSGFLALDLPTTSWPKIRANLFLA